MAARAVGDARRGGACLLLLVFFFVFVVIIFVNEVAIFSGLSFVFLVVLFVRIIIDQGRTLLIRRGSEPLRGEWSIPGGTLELGETLEEGVVRELLEETGIKVRVIEIIEVFDRIYADDGTIVAQAQKKPRFHYVIVDYLCERIAGDPRAGSDVTDVAFAREEELSKYRLTETATRILKKAFAMDRARRAAK